MYPTCEVRWFRRGALPPLVRAWFQTRGSHVASQAPRRDYYLYLPGETLGVKLREARLEVKLRRQQGEFVRLHPQVTGVLEHWHKWSFPLAAEAPAMPGVATSDSYWIAVDKSRSLYRFRVVGSESPAAVPADVYPVQGCEVELVEIHAGGQPWWSLCFEAFGQGRLLEESLLTTARYFLAVGDPPLLDIADSYAYPRWLAVLSPEG